MALELSLLKKKEKTVKKLAKGRIPTKRYINFMENTKRSMHWYVALPILVVILALAVLFGKFFVADKLDALSRSESALAAARNKLDAGYKRIEDFGELTELYGHYTYSGMTEEEINRADRIGIIDLISKHLIGNVTVGSWTVADNRLTIILTGESLQQINLLVQELEKEPTVDYCTVTRASTEDDRIDDTDDRTTVTAQVTVYLVKEAEGGEN